MEKTCIIISGPTAVGKTALAVSLAQQFQTAIISADSRQCYKELNIGVAKPSIKEVQAAPHYFINSHSIEESLSAADFEAYALASVKTVFSKNDIAIMVGGTGLYIRAFVEGLDPIPAVHATLRKTLIDSFDQSGIAWLQQQVRLHDHLFFKKGEMQNPQRMMRALEVKITTGRSILDFQTKQKLIRDFNILQVGLELPRPELYNRINKRVDDMMEAGLLAEVRRLLEFKNLNALQTVGYKELFDYFNGNTNLEKAIEHIKQNTRHYAKRQMTWFKKDPAINWIAPESADLNELVSTFLKKQENKI